MPPRPRIAPQTGGPMGATRSVGNMSATAHAIENGRLMRDVQEESPLKRAYVATLSHEIRTPLSNITGYWEMLADAALEPHSPEWEDVIGRIQRSVRELLDRVGMALDLAQLKADELTPASTPPEREAGR